MSPRKKPVRHKVSSYTRKDGTTVSTYIRGHGSRGERKPRNVYEIRYQEKLPGTNIPIEWIDDDFYMDSQQRVMMSPKTFLELSTPPPLGGFSEPSFDYHTSIFEDEEPFESLVLEVNEDTGQVGQHDGRHRAFWAYVNNIPSVPVTLYHTRKSTESNNQVITGRPLKRKLKISELKPQSKTGITAWDYAKHKWFSTDTAEEEETREEQLRREKSA
jgi:hypothetical protein